LAETIRDNGKQDVNTKKNQESKINLGVIEDYALGFR
jgi:alpha-tubulin suppressor-like RCC1 family protein